MIRGIGLLHSLQDIGNVVVSSSNGVPVLVKDLGEVRYDNVERRGHPGQGQQPGHD